MLNDNGTINYHQFIEFVKRERIGIHFNDPKLKDLRIVKEITNNIIDELNDNEFAKLVENELLAKFGTRDLSKFYADEKIFNNGLLKKFDRYHISKYKDTPESINMFFKDTVVNVTANEVNVSPWNDCMFGGQKVWRRNISDKKFTVETAMKFENSMWYNFCKNAVTAEGLEPLMRTLGYLMHNYKNPSISKMIVYADGFEDTDNITANGRSGKSLIAYEALKRIRKISFIEGKRFDDSRPFAFQTVDPLCDIVLIDDVKPDFKYKFLYNAVANYFSIEKKNLQPITMPFEESPKFVVTSNYGILSSGESDIARREVIGFSNYYNASYGPKDEFKCNFFSGWNEQEYNWFYGFFARCAQLYLEKGLTSFGNHNIDRKALINIVGSDFWEWAENKIPSFIGRDNAITTNVLMNEVPPVFVNRFVKADKIKINLIQVAHQLGYKVHQHNTTIGVTRGRYMWFEKDDEGSNSNFNPQDLKTDELPF